MSKVRFISPLDGDCVNSRDGRVEGDILYIPLELEASGTSGITVNGVQAKKAGNTYVAEIPLTGWRNRVTAVTAEGAEASLLLFRLKDCESRFRLSSDDNILFLADLHANREKYTSIFDNPYLAMYKKAHDSYEAKVHLNLFYCFRPEETHFSGKRDYFDLSMMTDRYREEFRANADWLRLAFHADSDFPDRPYKEAGFRQVWEEARKVNREICRFAGSECLGDATTIHWGDLTREGARALRSLGYRTLAGYFEFLEGEPLVAYYADHALTEHVGARDFWYDSAEDIFFGRIDLVLNSQPEEENTRLLREIMADPHRGGFVSIMIHEQYFYPDYVCYLPDFKERVLSACRILREADYQGAYLTETTAEPRLRENPMFI